MESKQRQHPVVDVTGDRSKVRCCKEQYCVLLLLSCFSCVQLCATPWIKARQASLSVTNSWSLLKLMSIESVMPSSHLILCLPLLLVSPIPPSIRVFSTGDQWRNNSRKNEEMEPKQKQYPAVDVIGDRSKVRCCKEQYCIGTWNVRSMNQGKLEVVKRDDKSECRHSRNQRTKMDWNG